VNGKAELTDNNLAAGFSASQLGKRFPLGDPQTSAPVTPEQLHQLPQHFAELIVSLRSQNVPEIISIDQTLMTSLILWMKVKGKVHRIFSGFELMVD
jgi:hypothetical protein